MFPLLNLPVAGVVSGFLQSSFAVQAIVVVLFVSSIAVWSLVVTRNSELNQTGMATKSFLDVYRKETHPLFLFVRREKHEATPLFAVYEKSCAALASSIELTGPDPTSDLFMRDITSANRILDKEQMDAIRAAGNKAEYDAGRSLYSNMRFLALAAIVAPIVGLTGMGLDAMDFVAAAIAGGDAYRPAGTTWVAVSLIPAVMGLLVAIPAGFGYALLNAKIGRLCAEMGSFTRELMAGIEQHYSPQK